MTEPVTLHNLYYVIDTEAWLHQRTGAHDRQASSQVQDFAGCAVFDDYTPSIGTAARMQLWCAAQGWQVAEGAPIEHDDACLSKPVTIVRRHDRPAQWRCGPGQRRRRRPTGVRGRHH